MVLHLILSGVLIFWSLASLVFCGSDISIRGSREKHLLSLIDATVEDLADGLGRGSFTSVDLVKTYIARINEVNSTLHAVTELNPDALVIAKILDAERANGKLRGPLHGLPILVKMNIGTKDKMETSAGSYALKGATLPNDSGVVAKLRAAGAIILGKANMSEWAGARSSNSTSGWSADGGQTLGAYYPNEDPNGSSTWSGVSVSVGLAIAALGTDTLGSIILPSSKNNVVGIRPTLGLTSRSLVVPISEHQDAVGPMAKTVKDVAYVLQAIAGRDAGDNYTSAIPSVPDYVAACNASSLVGKRIGIPRNAIPDNLRNGPGFIAFEAAVSILKQAGAVIVDNTNYTLPPYSFEDQDFILSADFATDLPRYLSKLSSNPAKVYNVADILNFTRRFRAEEYPDRNTLFWDGTLALGPRANNTTPEFWAAYQSRLSTYRKGGVPGALANYSLDALILPANISYEVPTTIGTPVVIVPMGSFGPNQPVETGPRGLIEVAPNIPFGLSFMGSAWSEASLIGFAYVYERRTNWRRRIKPYVAPTVELRDFVGLRNINETLSIKS